MASASTTPLPPLGVQDLFSTKGMVALITGGGTGLGLTMARALAEGGASKVYIAGRRLAVLEAAAASIEASLPKAEDASPSSPVIVPLQCDVTSKESLAAVAAHIEADAGFLNVVLCNAGIMGPQTAKLAPEDMTVTAAQFAATQLAVAPAAYTETFHVNVTAAWFTSMAMLSLLDAGNRSGNVPETPSQVLVTTSIAGFNRTSTGGWAYGQSKAATTLAIKQLATLLPRWGIRANGIAPGLFPSEMSATVIKTEGGFVPGQPVPLPTSTVPLGRMGDERDLAGTILYAVSRAGAYLNGNIFVLDGGRLSLFPTTY